MTNTGVNAKRAGVLIDSAGTITGSPYDANHHMRFAFREGYDTYGQPATSQSAAFASDSGTYKIVFANGGYSVSQNIVLKFYINGGNLKVNAGETDEQEWTTTDGSSFQTWTIPASSVSQLKNVQLTNSGNTGPYWSGIYVDGVQLVNPPGGSKKHYGNNAVFTTSHLATTADSDLALDSDQWTVEFWIKPDSGMTNEACPVRAGTDYSTDRSPYLGYLSGTNWQLYMSSGTGSSWDIAGGNNFGTLTVGTWKHYAIVRNGSSFKAYENGTETLSLTRNVGAVYQATNSWSIGKAFTSSGYYKGAIQDLRFYKGVAKYSANFTPPGAILG